MHFKIPIIQTANRLDKRILEWDGEPNEITDPRTSCYIAVDTYARWRIADPLAVSTSGFSDERDGAVAAGRHS